MPRSLTNPSIVSLLRKKKLIKDMSRKPFSRKLRANRLKILRIGTKRKEEVMKK